jgi:Ca2+-transporting ATPase
MATTNDTRERPAPADERWYALDAKDVPSKLGVVLESGLSDDEAAKRLNRDGPNALPVEKPPSTIHRFLAEYSSYMQLILVGAAIVSLFIKEWSTAIVLTVITLFNALVGLRQAGKAESAMNALQ